MTRGKPEVLAAEDSAAGSEGPAVSAAVVRLSQSSVGVASTSIVRTARFTMAWAIPL